MKSPPSRCAYITLTEIAARLSMLRVVCDRCGCEGRYRTDKLVAKYGPDFRPRLKHVNVQNKSGHDDRRTDDIGIE